MLLVICLSSLFATEAFQTQHRPTTLRSISSTCLHETKFNGRRKFLSRGAGAAMSVLVGGTVLGEPANASYTAYARREDDWKQRDSSGGKSPMLISYADIVLPSDNIIPWEELYAREMLIIPNIFHSVFRHQVFKCSAIEIPAAWDSANERCGKQNILPKWYFGRRFTPDGEQMWW